MLSSICAHLLAMSVLKDVPPRLSDKADVDSAQLSASECLLPCFLGAFVGTALRDGQPREFCILQKFQTDSGHVACMSSIRH